jgi:hypothetical protein
VQEAMNLKYLVGTVKEYRAELAILSKRSACSLPPLLFMFQKNMRNKTEKKEMERRGGLTREAGSASIKLASIDCCKSNLET